MRSSRIERKTNETDIVLELDLDGTGKARVETGCGFLDHMLILFASHGRFDIKLCCKGDTFVDFHHTAEDIGIVLGSAFKQALGGKKGIRRYGDTALPMDEALILTAVDFSGRSNLNYSVDGLSEKVGSFDTELCEEFWLAFTRNAECSLHIVKLAGKNTHHILEGVFKSTARTLREAVSLDDRCPNEVPSTKGVL